MDAFETYIRELHQIRASGEAVDETSYYGPLAGLLNEIGHHLKPRVRCIINIKNRGAGIPDGGLFAPDQFQKAAAGEPLPGTLPSRGVVECKGTADDAFRVAESEQVLRYLEMYRQVLVTTYRDFVLVGYDAEGRRATLESYSLAPSEKEFWGLAASPRTFARMHGERLAEFLKRVMLRPTQLVNPQDLAWFLASYARDARVRVEFAELPALTAIRKALEEALGMRFEGERGEHFFRSTLVQTLFYGVFSAWVLWSKQHDVTDTRARFDWRTAAYYLRIPILQKLFSDFTNPGQLGAIGLTEVLDWAGEALSRVDRASFFQKFQEGHAVQYFYEPFLEAFDPELRKELGVWYTPAEIVQYMVERVDAVLRSELGIADGLADERVYVLDPCCGTGAYLIEVLNRIAKTLREKGGDALLAHDIKKAATERVCGFEILPAPFVVSHLQVGMLLQKFGAPLPEQGSERAAVYLTNALTGWEPPSAPKQHLLFPELEAERDAAEHIKREAPILVILGNPPYNGFAGIAVDEERDLSTAYRAVKKVAPPQGQGLNDLYVRFFRMAERRIVEGSEGKGIVCFISNYSWLDGLSFTGMRERYLEAFANIWIDNLHGDRIISEYGPDGRTSETVFAMHGRSPGIKIGTSIALLQAAPSSIPCRLHYRDVDDSRAEERRRRLIASVSSGVDEPLLYSDLDPALEIGLPFKPRAVLRDYLTWPALPDLLPVSFPGVKTSRDAALVDIDRDRLVERMRSYFDPDVPDDEARRLAPALFEKTGRFNPSAVRRQLQRRGFLEDKVVRYCYRPFDVRWLYWEPETDLLDRNRADYFPHVFEGNLWVEARQRQPRDAFDRGLVTSRLADNMGNGLSSYFPLRLNPEAAVATLLNQAPAAVLPNLSEEAARYLDLVQCSEFELFCHIVGILHAPAYRRENAGALRQDWPRVPLPATRELLWASQAIGSDVVRLLDVESPVEGVTGGRTREELRALARVTSVDGRQLGGDANDLALSVGWGHAGQGGVTMPGKGKLVERAYAPDELASIEAGLPDLGMTLSQALSCLGKTTVDVYLNDVAYWRNVPARVWRYTIGGYQVMKKWLSYRESSLLGRPLTPDEAREVTSIARRIAAILLLEPALDANYRTVKASPFAWASFSQGGANPRS